MPKRTHWSADCEWGDLDPADIDALSARAIIRGIHQHYAGGWPDFIAGPYWSDEFLETTHAALWCDTCNQDFPARTAGVGVTMPDPPPTLSDALPDPTFSPWLRARAHNTQKR